MILLDTDHATVLHLRGLDHERLTYRYSGRYFRLTDVHAKVVTDITLLRTQTAVSGISVLTERHSHYHEGNHNMQNCFRAFVLLIAGALVVHAADNGKEIEALMRVHGEAVAKADKARELATEKSRDETVAKLVKLAGRAYAEKDRVGETNAWRNVLQLDRQHSKARRYFTDLGTLDQVEKELGESKVLESVDSKKLVGKWIVMFSNKVSGSIVIPKDGVVRRIGGENGAGKLTIEKGEVLLRIPAFIERYTIMGDRIFVEQWAPTETFPGSAPLIFGYGVRTE